MVKELTVYSSLLFQRETLPIESKKMSLSERVGNVFSSFIEECSSCLRRLGDAILGISSETLEPRAEITERANGEAFFKGYFLY